MGEYVNAGRGRRVTISPAVPGAQYRITAWALTGTGKRSATPAVEYVTTGEASECGLHDYNTCMCLWGISVYSVLCEYISIIDHLHVHGIWVTLYA